MRKERILVVEDEMIILLSIEEKLNSFGYSNIELAHTSDMAHDLLSRNEYDLVFMDINLGSGKTGIEIVSKIKMKKDIPIVYVTGNSDQKTINNAKLTTPYGFITKPINEIDLKIQLELTLFKEKISKPESEESIVISNIYEGDCNGLTMVLNKDKEIESVSPEIKKITGKVRCFYLGEKIEMVNFNKDFYMLLKNILDTVKEGSSQTVFYGEIFTPHLGQRLLKIDVAEKENHAYELVFEDLTEKSNHSISSGLGLDLVVVSSNEVIRNGFKAISNLITGSKIIAEIEDTYHLKEFLRSNKSGTLILDINLEGLDELLVESAKNEDLVKILMVSPYSKKEIKLLDQIDENNFDGYISKTANDSTFLVMFENLGRGEKYYDNSIMTLIKKYSL